MFLVSFLKRLCKKNKTQLGRKDFAFIDKLMKDSVRFNNFVYTPTTQIINEIKKRTTDAGLERSPLLSQFHYSGFFARNVITPNYEARHFVSLCEITSLSPVFFEYTADKFVPQNSWKHSLGHLLFFKGRGKHGGSIIEPINIINFNESNGKPISVLKTLWGESLVEFHHNWFFWRFPELRKNVFDGSEFFLNAGNTPQKFYDAFLKLFIKDNVLFENFLIEKEEWFVRNIFLPAFLTIYKQTGYKPLIVALDPFKMEKADFWTMHPFDERFEREIKNKLNINKIVL